MKHWRDYAWGMAAVVVVLVVGWAVYVVATQPPREPAIHTPVPSGSPRTVSPSLFGVAGWYEAEGLVAALPGFKDGDQPYDIQVCAFEDQRTNCLIVTVRDHCECPNGHVIALSPAVFYNFAPLSKTKIWVQIDGVRP